PEEPYGALLRSIVGQQLSTKAARAIWERTLAIFDGRVPTPEELLAVDPEKLRAAGNSRPKGAFMRSLAEHVLNGELELDRLDELSDEEIAAELTAVKGLGQWSADVFLIFHLGRPAVAPVPLARLALPLALAGQRAGLGRDGLADRSAVRVGGGVTAVVAVHPDS